MAWREKMDSTMELAELQSREKCLLSIQESVADSNKHLDSIRQSLEERAKEIEHKHHEFRAFQEQHLDELKMKEEQVDLMRKSVEERIKEMELREEKLIAHQRSIEKQFQNIQKLSIEILEEINGKEMQLESTEALLQFARKCINDVLESCSNGKKRKQQSEGEFKKKHKISDLTRESATCINTSSNRARNLVLESNGSANIELMEKSKSFLGEDNRVIHLENEVKRLEEESIECKKGFDQLKEEEEKFKLEATAVKLREADLLKQVEELKRQLSYKDGMIQSLESVVKTMFFNMNKVPEVVDSSPIWRRGRETTEAIPSSKEQAIDPHGPILKVETESTNPKVNGSCPKEKAESTGTEKMSTPKTADFRWETVELRRSPRELKTNPQHLNGTKENDSSCLAGEKIYATVDSSPKKVPKVVFNDFSMEKSVGKFQPGQIWAMYKDGLPNRYAQIKKIQYPQFDLQVKLLELCTLEQPLCCGIFRLQTRKAFFPPSSFSHMVEAKPIRKNVFEIYPKRGEIWAVYRNWNADFSQPDVKNCEYDIVEVLDDTVESTEVSSLVRVTGFKSVFRSSRRQRSNTGVLVIPNSELGRFSHQIPAFQLTGEKDGSLRGYWELDPAALHGQV